MGRRWVAQQLQQLSTNPRGRCSIHIEVSLDKVLKPHSSTIVYCSWINSVIVIVVMCVQNKFRLVILSVLCLYCTVHVIQSTSVVIKCFHSPARTNTPAIMSKIYSISCPLLKSEAETWKTAKCTKPFYYWLWHSLDKRLDISKQCYTTCSSLPQTHENKLYCIAQLPG